MRIPVRPLAALIAASMLATMPTAVAQAPPKGPTVGRREEVRAAVARADEALRGRPIADDLRADAAVFARAAEMMDRLDEYRDPGDVDMLLGQVAVGLARAEALLKGDAPWSKEAGSVVRGYLSKLDGSAQPYAVEIPDGLDRDRAARLDVVLHGRNDAMDEARFIKAHQGKKVPGDRPYRTLHVFGRGNNAYRWAGEADVFEAIEAVKRNYKVDDDRVVLRGFSMGGAGAWHIGLHDPSIWSSVEAGAGFTETLKYAKLDAKTLPAWRAKALTIYDSVDYARNAFGVPFIGYGGEIDPQLRASENIIDALKSEGVAFKADGLVTTAEGLDFRRVVGRGMGHKVDPASRALLDAFHDEHARRGLDRTPRRVRFVTYTLAYNTAHWISVERLAEHYRRASVDADLDGEVATIATSNVAVLAVDRQVAERVRLDGVELPLRLAAKRLLPRVYYLKGADGWEVLEHEPSFALMENLERAKAPGVQGPIDDAFRGPFLIVGPTGTPWNPAVDAWAKSRLDRFAAAWRRHFRGEVRVATGGGPSEEDIASKNLVLFGDPGSNPVLARVLKGLPIEWTRERFVLGGAYDASTHAPALIAPNPLNPKRYVVVNSGSTFETTDFTGTNALLFPRLGDFAVFRLRDGSGEAVASGFFNERWRLPK